MIQDGLIFGGVNAAFGGVFTFDNQQGLDMSVPEGLEPQQIVLTVNKIECSQDGSCEVCYCINRPLYCPGDILHVLFNITNPQDAVFVTGEHVLIREVNCATDACYGCLIKEKATDVGMPCDPEFFARPTPPPTNAVTPAPVTPAPVTPAPVLVTPAPVFVATTTVDPQFVTVPNNPVTPAPVTPAIPAVQPPV